MDSYDSDYRVGGGMSQNTQDLIAAVSAAAVTAAAAHVLSKQNPGDNSQAQTKTVTGSGCRCGGVFGGNEIDSVSKIAEYNSSISSRIKQSHMNELISVFEGIGVEFSNRNDINAVLADISKTIPSLDMKGAANPFNKKLDRQEEVVEKIVNVVNLVMQDMYGIESLIDKRIRPEEAITALIKWALAIKNGYMSEYSLVKNAISELVENIDSADSITGYIYKKISELESKKPSEFGSLKVLYQKSRDIYKEHMNRLKDFLKIEPKTYANIVATNGNYDLFDIQNGRVTLSIRSNDFGDAISYLLSLLKNNIELANDIEKQIKDLGVDLTKSIQELTFDEFENQVVGKIRQLDSTSTNEDIKRYEKAKKAIRDTFIALKKTGGSETISSYSVGKTVKSQDSQYETRVSEGLNFIREYVRAIGNNYSRIFIEMKNFIGDIVSSKSDERIDLGQISDSFSNLASLLESNAMIDVELLELSDYSVSASNKELYIGYINALVGALKSYSSFNSSVKVDGVCSALEQVLATVSHYSTLVRSKNVNFDRNAIFAVVKRSSDDVRKGIYETLYRIYLHNMRINWTSVNKDIAANGESYEKILGEALATVISEINTTIASDTKELATVSNEEYSIIKRDAINKYRIRINFYKALQAIDLYIKKFTLSATSIPTISIDMQKLLSNTQLIANWFNDETGTDLARLLDVVEYFSTDYYHNKNVAATAARNGAALNALPAAINNAVAAAIIGVNRSPASEHIPAEDSYTSKHYYETCVETKIPNNQRDDAYGIEPAPIDPDYYDTCKQLNSNIYDKYQGLKNIVNMFSRIVINPSETEGVFMTPNQIYIALVEFMKSITFSFKANSFTESAKPNGANPPILFNKKIVGVHINTINNLQDGKELMYFASAVSAMAAKIITTLKLYEMQTQTVPVCDIIKTRMVLGGSEARRDKLEYIPDAAEYYFRLPRLAEFYVTIFYVQDEEIKPINLSMIPDVEGIFSELITYVWKYMSDIKGEFKGEYYESEIMDLTLIINRIYRFYTKETANNISKCIDDFVKNMNRKFVLLTKTELARVQKSMEKNKNKYSIESNNNIAILPGETHQLMEEIMNLPAPSDAYSTGTQNQNKYTYNMADVKDAVDVFISKFDKELSKCSSIRYFRGYIKQKQLDMRNNAGDSQRLASVTDLINTTKVLNKNGIDVYMFHETVVLGLDALYRIVQEIESYPVGIDIVGRFMNTACGAANPTPANTVAAIAAAGANLINAKREVVASVYTAINFILNTCASEETGIFEFQLNNAQIELQYGRLKRKCESLLDFIKLFINKFRNTMPYSVINKYEVQDSNFSVRALSDKFEDIFKHDGLLTRIVEHINGLFTVKPPTGGTPQQVNLIATTIQQQSREGILEYVVVNDVGRNIIKNFKTTTHTIYGMDFITNNESFISKFNKALSKYINTIMGDSDALSIPAKSIFSNLLIPFYNGYLLKERKETMDVGAFAEIMTHDNVQAFLAMNFLAWSVPNDPLFNITSIKSEILTNSSKYNTTPRSTDYLTNVLSDVPSVFRDLIKCRGPILIATYKFFARSAEILEQLVSKYGVNFTRSIDRGVPQLTAIPGNINPRPLGFKDANEFNKWIRLIRNLENSAYLKAVALKYIGTNITLNVLQAFNVISNDLCQISIYDGGVGANAGVARKLFTRTFSADELLSATPDDPNFTYANFNIHQSLILDDANRVAVIVAPANNNCTINKVYTTAEIKNMVNKISNCATVVATVLSHGLKEIGDNPVYLETGENSLDTLNMLNKKVITMPVSLVSSLLGQNKILHDVKYSDPEFGLLYGSRLLLMTNQKLRTQHIPNTIKSLSSLNTMRAEIDKITESELMNYLQNTFDIMRSLLNTRIAYNINSVKKSILYFDNADIQSSMDSIFKDTTVYTKICKFINSESGDADEENPRLNENVASIIELNVMPLNLHALMQSVPLINILNYSAAFTTFTAHLYGSHKSQTISNMLNMVKKPYSPFSGPDAFDPYDDSWHRMFMGGDNHLKDRPKFISDQIYLKALYGSVTLPKNKTRLSTESEQICGLIHGMFTDYITPFLVTALQGFTPNNPPRFNVGNVIAAVGAGNIDLLNNYNAKFGIDPTNLRPADDWYGSYLFNKYIESVLDEYINALLQKTNYITDNFHDVLLRYKQNFANTNPDIINFKILQKITGSGSTVMISKIFFAMFTLYKAFGFGGDRPPVAVRGVGIGLMADQVHTEMLSIARHIWCDFTGIINLGVLNAGVTLFNKHDLLTPNPVDNYTTIDAFQTARAISDPNGNPPAAAGLVIIWQLKYLESYYSTAPSSYLTYYQKDGNADFYGVESEVQSKLTMNECVNASKGRFDTVIVRNLLFVSEVQRMVRILINRSMTVSNSQLLTSSSIGNASTTEYGIDPFVKLEQIDDAPYDKSKKYDLEKF